MDVKLCVLRIQSQDPYGRKLLQARHLPKHTLPGSFVKSDQKIPFVLVIGVRPQPLARGRVCAHYIVSLTTTAGPR